MAIKWHRRDYQMVADVIADTVIEVVGPIRDTKSRMISMTIATNMRRRFEVIFADDNPRFNREKFVEASMVMDGIDLPLHSHKTTHQLVSNRVARQAIDS